MASFIIPSGFGGLISPRTIYMDNGVNLTTTPQVTIMKFGDGYKQIRPLSNPKRSASVTFSNRDPSEINLIESYFIHLAGGALPSLTILDETWVGIVTSFNKNYFNGALYSLSSTIAEL
jgi:phage-related protein